MPVIRSPSSARWHERLAHLCVRQAAPSSMTAAPITTVAGACSGQHGFVPDTPAARQPGFLMRYVA